MEQKKKRKLTKAQIRSIIVASISAIIAIALIITNFFVPVKYLASFMVLRNKGAEDGVMRVRFVDVGYGDCIIIELPDGKNMLIDAGNGRSGNVSAILKFLNQSDIDVIDYLVCSSVNAEHCGGLSEIIGLKKVNKIYMPYTLASSFNEEFSSFTNSAKLSGAEIATSEYGAGEQNAESGYFFKFLSPSVHSNPMGEYAELNQNPSSTQAKNNVSAVIWLEYAGTSFMFTSDVEDEVLKFICDSYFIDPDNYPVKLEECNIVQVAGHGNSDSACAEFYDTVKPETAVISVGDNGYGCPSEEARFNVEKHVGEKLYRTDKMGTVTVEVNKDGYKIN